MSAPSVSTTGTPICVPAPEAIDALTSHTTWLVRQSAKRLPLDT
jgi:hypothetical protein